MPRYSKRFLETKHPTLYARRVKGDFVKLFKDHEAENGFYAFPLGHPQRPRHGRKWITINNFRWKLEWLPDEESMTHPAPSTTKPKPENSDPKR